jgi:predicted nucleic acid-binding protein
MKYVIDSSVAFKWVVAELDSDRALRLLDDSVNGIHDLIAPDLFPTEVANALASAEKSVRIQAGEAPSSFFLAC